MTTPRVLAQEAARWYMDRIDNFVSHSDNVQRFLRDPVIALTVCILQSPTSAALAPEAANERDVEPAIEKSPISSTNAPLSCSLSKTMSCHWKEYLDSHTRDGKPQDTTRGIMQDYDQLSVRSKARLDAFLTGVSLALPAEEIAGNGGPVRSTTGQRHSNRSSTAVDRKLSSSYRTATSKVGPLPQITESDLATRLELYLRNLQRVVAAAAADKTACGQTPRECVVAQEPMRVIRARAHAIVAAFVETVSTVRHIAPVLTQLLTALTQEVLAVPCLSEEVQKLIRRIITDYEHRTSFASLAFLSTPEVAADKNLTPLVLQYLGHLRANWELLEQTCDVEFMLQTVLDSRLRNTFKTVEFQSIGHLLEVCQRLRPELQRIELPPRPYLFSNEDALRQAIRDLKREVITINGQVLPPVTSRHELVQLLSQTLNSKTLTATRRSPRYRRKHYKSHHTKEQKENRIESTDTEKTHSPDIHRVESKASDMSDDTAFSSSLNYSSEGETTDPPTTTRRSQRRNFLLSTIDYLTKRLLIAGSRTGMVGDAYFVVRDLFGGDDVEVVPSAPSSYIGRRETIEIVVRLASITIRCHGSFDVYPRSLVGMCEPLIQIRTTTAETISLQEVRASEGSDDGVPDEDVPPMIVQELATAKTGWRILSIRPALYEKVEVWNTPS